MTPFIRQGVAPAAVDLLYDEPVFPLLHKVATYHDAIWLEDDKHDTVFVCRDPTHALQWLCTHSSRSALLDAIQSAYAVERNQEQPDTDDDCSVVSFPHPPNAPRSPPPNTASPGPSSNDTGASEYIKPVQKRKRIARRERLVTRTIRQRTHSDHTNTWMSLFKGIQDTDSDRTLMYNEEHVQYSEFLEAQPATKSIDLARARDMIRAATVVASFEALEDWQRVMRLWRRSHKDNSIKDISGNFQARPALPQPSGINTSADGLLQSKDGTLVLGDIAGTEWKTLYYSALNGEGRDIIEGFCQRWRYSSVYQFYDRLDTALNNAGTRSGRTGVGTSTLAKEMLYSLLCNRDQDAGANIPDKTSKAWEDMDRMIEYGRRWDIIRSTLGLGAFALIPEAIVPNRFIYKVLSIERLGVWVEMIAKCNPKAVELAKKIEGLFQDCVEGNAPPKNMYKFELVQDWEHGIKRDSNSLLALLEPALTECSSLSTSAIC